MSIVSIKCFPPPIPTVSHVEAARGPDGGWGLRGEDASASADPVFHDRDSIESRRRLWTGSLHHGFQRHKLQRPSAYHMEAGRSLAVICSQYGYYRLSYIQTWDRESFIRPVRWCKKQRWSTYPIFAPSSTQNCRLFSALSNLISALANQYGVYFQIWRRYAILNILNITSELLSEIFTYQFRTCAFTLPQFSDQIIYLNFLIIKLVNLYHDIRLENGILKILNCIHITPIPPSSYVDW